MSTIVKNLLVAANRCAEHGRWCLVATKHDPPQLARPARSRIACAMLCAHDACFLASLARGPARPDLRAPARPRALVLRMLTSIRIRPYAAHMFVTHIFRTSHTCSSHTCSSCAPPVLCSYGRSMPAALAGVGSGWRRQSGPPSAHTRHVSSVVYNRIYTFTLGLR